MIVPVNAQKDEAEEVTQKDRDERTQRLQRGIIRGPQIEHHDGDDDRQDAVAESLQSSLAHASPACRQTIEDMGQIGMYDIALVAKANLLHHSSRGSIGRQGDADQLR
jgi:hypothetical protein